MRQAPVTITMSNRFQEPKFDGTTSEGRLNMGSNPSTRAHAESHVEIISQVGASIDHDLVHDYTSTFQTSDPLFILICIANSTAKAHTAD